MMRAHVPAWPGGTLCGRARGKRDDTVCRVKSGRMPVTSGWLSELAAFPQKKTLAGGQQALESLVGATGFEPATPCSQSRQMQCMCLHMQRQHCISY